MAAEGADTTGLLSGLAPPAPSGPASQPATAATTAQAVSGLYLAVAPNRGELRVDVDGPQPQMTVSGTVTGGLSQRLHWIAQVRRISAGVWRGDVWFRDGTAALMPHRTVQVTAASGQRVVAVFTGGATRRTVTYARRSSGYRTVEFEFDVVEGARATTAIDTWAHPNRPAALPREVLTLDTVYRRAGFDVVRSPGGGAIPLHGSGADRVWSDSELHDAMQTFWSRFANRNQWSLWVLFAALHEQGTSLGGIMFDQIGPQHRQGTAIFSDSFVAQPPAGDSAPAAWVDRMQFWTAAHEMGHAFNLAHAWQKTLNSASWVRMRDEPEGRSFMNYPFRVAGGQTAFFRDFAYRFTDQELLFMRHAPERFVQMGAASWFDRHGFEQAELRAEPKFRLALRVNRTQPAFEFMEPVVAELKLTNVSGEPALVREHALRDAERLVIVIQPERGEARQWLPYAHYCSRSPKTVLEAGASAYETLFLGAGLEGWGLAEPGRYTLHALARIDDEDVVSEPLRLVIRTPASFEEERLAQDFFSDDVGRVLAFDGTRVLEAANEVLEETAARLPDKAVARHARVALGKGLINGGKVLSLAKVCREQMAPASDLGAAVEVGRRDPEAAAKQLATALLVEPTRAARTLSHVDFNSYADDLAGAFVETGDMAAAARVHDTVHDALAARGVPAWVLAEVKEKAKQVMGPEA